MNRIESAAHALEAAQSAFELALSTDTGQVSKERYRELEQAVSDAMYEVVKAVREERDGK